MTANWVTAIKKRGSVCVCAQNYQQEYLKYGFIATAAKDEPQPKCILCLETLAIDSI